MVENYVKAEKDYMSGMKYKDIADKYSVSINTVKSWKTRHKWSKDAKEKGVHTKPERVHTKKKEEKPVVESDDLTDKQRLFCVYYIKCFNATKAYQKAYECDYMTAQSIAYRLMGNDGVRAEIDRLKAERAAGMLLNADAVLQKWIDIAFADIGDYVRSDDGYLVSLKPLDEVDTSIVSEIGNTENGPKLKLANREKALEMLSKYFDLLSDNDKKRLQEEKLKAETAKLKAELENISNDNTNNGGEDWTEALMKVSERRRLQSEEK